MPPHPLPQVIRTLTAPDVEAFRAIRLEALQHHPEAFGSTYEDEVAQDLAWWEGRLAPGRTFGGFLGERLMGMAALSTFTAARLRHKGVLGGMYVREEARGTGLADALVRRVIGQAGLAQVQLSVVTSNERAVRFYRRMGFHIFGTEPRALTIDGGYADEHLMVRLAGPDNDQRGGSNHG